MPSQSSGGVTSEGAAGKDFSGKDFLGKDFLGKDNQGKDQPAREAIRHAVAAFEQEDKGVERLEFASIEDLDSRSANAGQQAELVAALEREVDELEDQLDQQARATPAKIEEAKLLARLLARKDWEAELYQRLAEERAKVQRACAEFERERTRYFAAVESQVVKLSLAIAARVLNREAKMDPLLLSAAVRVALEKVKEESGTRLRVPAAEVAVWTAEFERSGLAHALTVVGEDGMLAGECVLETSVGTVELGIAAQLGEIERGFYDLMQKRPA